MYTTTNEKRSESLRCIWKQKPTGRIITLAGTLALVSVPRLCQVVGAVTVGANRSVGYPGFVHTSLHALHDQIQQNLHSMAHVFTVCSACLKVRDTARRRRRKIKRIPTEFGTRMLLNWYSSQSIKIDIGCCFHWYGSFNTHHDLNAVHTKTYNYKNNYDYGSIHMIT